MYSRFLLVYFFIYVFFFSGGSYIFLLFVKKLISFDASILLLNSLIIFTIITLNSFSGRLPISRSLSSSCVCVSVCVLIFICLFALAFSCRLQNLWSSFQHADSLVAACKLLVVDLGSSSLIRDRTQASFIGSTVLATEPPGKSLLLGFYLVPSSGTYSSVASFCLSCCVHFYVFCRLVTFLDFREVAFCRKCPLHPSSVLPSHHPSYML